MTIHNVSVYKNGKKVRVLPVPKRTDTVGLASLLADSEYANGPLQLGAGDRVLIVAE